MKPSMALDSLTHRLAEAPIPATPSGKGQAHALFNIVTNIALCGRSFPTAPGNGFQQS